MPPAMSVRSRWTLPGILWAVLYHGDIVLAREQVRSLRRGKRRVADLLLSAADASPQVFAAPAHRISTGS